MTDALPPYPRIAIVRFSALGDVVMVAAAVRAVRRTLPDAAITWITSPLAHSLLEGMAGVNFIVTDKPRNLSDYRAFYRLLGERRFDAVLAMQANLRINLLYPALHSPLKIGFDRTRARELQWLFCNRNIPFGNDHLVDSFLAFVTELTGAPARAEWELPITHAEQTWAQEKLSALPRPLLALHPVSSKAERNWLTPRYAKVIELAIKFFDCGIVITGGNADDERALCARLAQVAPHRTLNLCGQTTPKQLAAVLAEADVLIAPDTAAVHLARAVGTPVIGLYAVAPASLTGPYQRTEYCIDRYADAVREYLGKDPAHLPWNTRVHHPGAMALIEVEDVMQQLARVLGDRT
ncbi:MAG: glycosyltransferase family 9 protein [Halothiobacillaceae bacterium]|nr:glycosyltransferase family 9 protein [Halothiobacillaceae bacterium]